MLLLALVANVFLCIVCIGGFLNCSLKLIVSLYFVAASFCYTVLHGLKGKTVYQVRMHAENRKGAGPASSVKVTTGVPDDEGIRL